MAPVTGHDDDLATAESIAGQLVTRNGVSLDAVGIAVPGVIDRRRGRLLHANDKYGWLEPIDLMAWGATAFNAPTILENDARAALMGEVSYGDAGGARDAIMLILGIGIGTAAMIDGVLLRGAHDHAGILGGHITVDVNGRVCPCGNVGCGEALASTWALRNSDRENEGGEPSIADGVRGLIARAETRQDLDARALLDQFIRVRGAAVVGLVHAYDPDVVILSGGVLRAGAVLRDPIEAYVTEQLWRSLPTPRLVHHDSSISHGYVADSTNGTWPVVAARRADVDLTSLAFSGSALLDPFVSRVIRDTPADVLSIKVGINLVNGDLMRQRTFATAVEGFLDTIRDGHPATPIIVASALYCEPVEHVAGPTLQDPSRTDPWTVAGGTRAEVGAGKLSLGATRRILRSTVDRRSAFDAQLHYVDGLTLYGAADAMTMPLPDNLHPGSDVHELVGERFARILRKLGSQSGSRSVRSSA